MEMMLPSSLRRGGCWLINIGLIEFFPTENAGKFEEIIQRRDQELDI